MYANISNFVIPVHPLNASSPICTNVSGNISFPVIPSHPLKLSFPIATSPFFNSIFRFVHPLNVSFPITVSLSGNSTCCKLLHPLNADDDICCSPSGNTIVSNVSHPSNALCPIFIMLSGNITFVTSCPFNASSAIVVTTSPSIFAGISNVSGIGPDMYFSALAFPPSYLYSHVIPFSSVTCFVSPSSAPILITMFLDISSIVYIPSSFGVIVSVTSLEFVNSPCFVIFTSLSFTISPCSFINLNLYVSPHSICPSSKLLLTSSISIPSLGSIIIFTECLQSL